MGSSINEWSCGACGGRHGWVCPYFGGPSRENPPPCSEAEGRRRMERDKAAKAGPFSYLKGALAEAVIRAAHSVIAGKVAELEAALNRIADPMITGTAAYAIARAALAPHPKGIE